MRFHLTGINHSTGARMSLELEAESKAAAERKARNAGMDVQHVQPKTDGNEAHHEHQSHRGEDAGGGGSGMLIKLLVTVVIIAAVAYFAIPRIRAMVGH